MNCKNCQKSLEKYSHFCNNCGAKVVLERITFKKLFIEFFILNFGIDSRFFRTLREMIISPQYVIADYLEGIRRRYINPFAYLAVGAGLSLIVFNYYSDEYKAIQSSMNSEQIDDMKKVAEQDLSTIKNISEKELKALKAKQESARTTLHFLENYVNFIIHNFNLVAFLFIPFYAFISLWTYRKPYNFGEHIVINAYLQGTTMYFSVIAFFLAMYTNPKVFAFSVLVYIIYYLFAFSKLYKHSFGKAILKFLRFILVLAITLLLLLIIGILLGIGFMILKKTIGF